MFCKYLGRLMAVGMSLVLIVLAIATPTGCEYMGQHGPEWVRNSVNVNGPNGVELSFTLIFLILLAAAGVILGITFTEDNK